MSKIRTAPSINEMLRQATKQAKQAGELEDHRHSVIKKFFEQAEAAWGMGADDFGKYLKDALDLAKQKQDVKTMEKLLNVWYTLLFSPTNSIKSLVTGASSLQRLQAGTDKSTGTPVGSPSDEPEELDADVVSPEDELAAVEAELREYDDSE